MSESKEHNTYIENIINYFYTIVPHEYHGLIMADTFECEKPMLTYCNYVPDVFYSYNELMIIGEAKTLNDFNTRHSYMQYESYLKECLNYPFKSMIVLCVPWELFITAKNHFRLLKRKFKCTDKIQIVILTNTDLEGIV